MTIKEWQVTVHAYAKDKGWWDRPRPIPELLCLLHAEVSEALEAYRTHDVPNLREELADLAIRLVDMCEALGINLEAEMQKKHEINLTRPYRHGNKEC
jgi:NTP pyrophosphatase (non-canonical NTP hydrolase)